MLPEYFGTDQGAAFCGVTRTRFMTMVANGLIKNAGLGLNGKAKFALTDLINLKAGLQAQEAHKAATRAASEQAARLRSRGGVP